METKSEEILIEIRNIKSEYNKGTIRADLRYLVVSIEVRRHRLISSDYIKTLYCHGRGQEFESRRPRHSFLALGPRDARAGRISTQGGSIDFQLFLLHFCPCHGNALVSGYASGLEE